MHKLERFKIVIIIPAYNEETTIKSVVEQALNHADVIVVNDASIENTGEIALCSGAIVINHTSNRGYDQALNSGFIEADKRNYDAVITFDADGQHNTSYLKEYIRLINENYDVVIGIRSNFQRIAEYVFSWVSMARWGIHDPLCGMKGYHIDVFKNLGHFDSYNSIGTELSIFAVKSKMKIAQLHIKVNKRNDKSRFGNRFLANIRIFYSLWKGMIKDSSIVIKIKNK